MRAGGRGALQNPPRTDAACPACSVAARAALQAWPAGDCAGGGGHHHPCHPRPRGGMGEAARAAAGALQAISNAGRAWQRLRATHGAHAGCSPAVSCWQARSWPSLKHWRPLHARLRHAACALADLSLSLLAGHCRSGGHLQQRSDRAARHARGAHPRPPARPLPLHALPACGRAPAAEPPAMASRAMSSCSCRAGLRCQAHPPLTMQALLLQASPHRGAASAYALLGPPPCRRWRVHLCPRL